MLAHTRAWSAISTQKVLHLPVLFGIVVIFRGIRELVKVEAFRCDHRDSGGGFAVLRVEGATQGTFVVVVGCLFERRLQGFSEAGFLDELDVGIAF